MRREILITAAAMGVVLLLLAGVKYLQIARAMAEQANFRPAPESITAVTVSEERWPELLHAVGTLSSSQGVMLSAEAAGAVERIHFKSGERVEAGTLLLEIDSSVEQAQLKGAQALLQDAGRNLARVQSLRSGKVSSQADFDSASAKAHTAEAAVESLQATIAHKRVRAPFSGRLGIRQVNLGQYVTPGSALVQIHALDPLHVDFSLPQQNITEVALSQKVHISVDAYPSEIFEATLSAMNPEIDPVTRHVQLQASLPNPDERLRAGMFVRVRLLLPRERSFVTIPASSVQYAPYGDMVYVIESTRLPAGEPQQSVRQQVVKLGPARGDQVAVLSGLRPGDRIATSGAFKLRPGAAVRVDESITPANSADPAPADT